MLLISSRTHATSRTYTLRLNNLDDQTTRGRYVTLSQSSQRYVVSSASPFSFLESSLCICTADVEESLALMIAMPYGVDLVVAAAPFRFARARRFAR